MSGFNFGTATPQQQQPQQPTTYFGAPLASSMSSMTTFGTGNVSASPSLFSHTLTSTNLAGSSTGFFQNQPIMTSQPQYLAPTGYTLGSSAPSGYALVSSAPTGCALSSAPTGCALSSAPTGCALSSAPTGCALSSAPTGFALGSSAPTTGFTLGSSAPTGFTLGSSAPSVTSTPGSGFNFGIPVTVPAPVTTAVTNPATNIGGTLSLGGLGGIPGSVGPRVSTVALGNDPGTGWSTRHENRAVQELPVPPEIVAIAELLKAQMKNHKSKMMEITRASDVDVDSVAEQIEDVRSEITSLVNMMHKQELLSASLISDMQELSKDVDLLSQAKDVEDFGHGTTSIALHNFLFELIRKYSARMLKYKVEIERAEFSLQTIVGAYNVNAKDLWASLAAIKDSVILLAAQIQQLHEEIRSELSVHKNMSQVLYATSPKPWVSKALSGNAEIKQSAPPLERVLSTPSKPTSAVPSLETMFQRTYSMLDRVPSLTDSRSILMPTPEGSMRPSSSNAELSAALMGSYTGPSSPAASASLKRSKK